MGEILTVEDIRRSSWREDLEERQNYEDARRKRELAKEHEQQQARKAREAETASADWYAAIDTRIRTHFKDWAWAAIDERIHEHLERFTKMYNEDAGEVIGKIRARARTECKAAIEALVDEIGAKL